MKLRSIKQSIVLCGSRVTGLWVWECQISFPSIVVSGSLVTDLVWNCLKPQWLQRDSPSVLIIWSFRENDLYCYSFQPLLLLNLWNIWDYAGRPRFSQSLILLRHLICYIFSFNSTHTHITGSTASNNRNRTQLFTGHQSREESLHFHLHTLRQYSQNFQEFQVVTSWLHGILQSSQACSEPIKMHLKEDRWCPFNLTHISHSKYPQF